MTSTYARQVAKTSLHSRRPITRHSVSMAYLKRRRTERAAAS